MDFDTDIKPKLTAAARWAMALAAGYLAQHGLLSTTTTGAFEDAGAAAILALGAIVWSLIQKELQKRQVQQALATPVLGTMTVEEAAAKLLPAILNALPSTAAVPTVSVEVAAPGVSASPPVPLTDTAPDKTETARIPWPSGFGPSVSPSIPPASVTPSSTTVFKPAGLP